jgi:ketosteroid isomerase-like protein
MDHGVVGRWVAAYERAWRTAGTGSLTSLFTDDATYLPSPWARELQGIEEISRFWESERDGPDEEFTMTSRVVAVEDGTAVVRVEVEYGSTSAGRWRDLWVLRLDEDGMCRRFEEWPFAPGQSDGH